MSLYNYEHESEWNLEAGEDIELAKKEILTFLSEQKISLSKARLLFRCILEEIENKNTIHYRNGNF